MPDMPPVLSVKEAAEYLGVSPWTVYEYCRQGVISHRRIGRRVLINREVLGSWFRDGELERRAGCRAQGAPGAAPGTSRDLGGIPRTGWIKAAGR